ncbi:MAG: rod shape-determining protein RodA [Gammaproteobacteria bacterium]|nr:rod shape-determining protein RodA [Gammaproteobacteria bacterium]
MKDREPGGLWLNRIAIDGWLLFGVLVLCAVGLAVLYSASGQDPEVVLRQGLRMSLGLGAMLGIAQIPPRQLARWAPWVYAAGIVMLVLVLIFGLGRGAQRWLDLGILRFQPSELMKLAVPVAVAALIAGLSMPLRLGYVLAAAAMVVVPVVLVARQPDLGTALLIGASGAFVLFLAGLSWRFIAVAATVTLSGLPTLWFMMHDYQRQRILTLFNPETDPLGSGYHIIQSKIAVGSGGLYGKGWLLGTQSRLEFIPERSTDFIFAVFCEEFGFIGVALLSVAYAFVIARGLYIAAHAQDSFGRWVAGSLTLIFFVYIFVNMSMVIGQLPVVGIPLPLISYGGTSLVTLMASFGILMSVHSHRRMLSGV